MAASANPAEKYATGRCPLWKAGIYDVFQNEIQTVMGMMATYGSYRFDLDEYEHCLDCFTKFAAWHDYPFLQAMDRLARMTGDFISPDEAAEGLGTTAQDVVVDFERGHLPGKKVGRRCLINRNALLKLLKAELRDTLD